MTKAPKTGNSVLKWENRIDLAPPLGPQIRFSKGNRKWKQNENEIVKKEFKENYKLLGALHVFLIFFDYLLLNWCHMSKCFIQEDQVTDLNCKASLELF